MEPSDLEVAWLAGILEGEGSFWMLTNRVSGKSYRYPKIVVNMCDRDIIERVAAMFGNSVYDLPIPRNFPDRQPAYRAEISGAGAAAWMRRLYPWLGQRRRAKIDEVLAEYELQEPTAVRRARSCSEAAAVRPRRDDGTFLTSAAQDFPPGRRSTLEEPCP